VDWLSWLRRPTTAWVLAGLTVLFAAAMIPLSLAARQNPLATAGPEVAVCVSFAGEACWAHAAGGPVSAFG
jgi:hypothetical protein